jgi:mono/diheme cytochrome c family protein
VRFLRRNAVPFAAGVAAAVAAFTVVLLTTNDGANGRAPDGRQVAAAASGSPLPEGLEGGLAVFTRMGCGGCHRLAAAGSTGPIGPDLDERLPNHTRESITAQILSPGGAYSSMPDDFGERMSDAELDALVDFLLAVREPR